MLTTEQFISRAEIKHKYSYDYTMAVYVNSKQKVKIICSIHGIYEQAPGKHLSGKGCPVCGGSQKSNTNSFINKSIKIHGDKYDYSLVEYIRAHSHIKIICKIHGIFLQAPTHHLSGKGCVFCMHDANRVGLEKFIQKSNTIHNNKYDYSLSIYVRTDRKVIIICPDHGKFSQNPNAHINGNGCPKCVHTTSKPEIEWLNSLNIKDGHKSIRIDGILFKVDGFDQSTNTVYEFYGDFWHGNPKIYPSNKINIINKKPFGELYAKTVEKENILKSAGYKVISIWESEWKEQNKYNKTKEA